MAPELWMDELVIGFDEAVDIYAFGVTAIALVSQQLPPELLRSPPTPIIPLSIESILNGLPIEIVEILIQCLASAAVSRPSISTVEEVFRRHLLQGRHRALLVMNGTAHEINSTAPTANITCGTLGSMQIYYNGTLFIVKSYSGNVLVNNNLVVVGQALPSCCVIAFGVVNRRFMTFDVSNPEVTA